MRISRKTYLVNEKSIHEYYDQKDKLIQVLTYLARQGKFVFRGYTKQDQLLPNIIRDKDLSKHERFFLNEFEKYGSHYFVASNSMDFLSYAQHYGLPTRLLDFTYNPFIALSFALFANKGPNYKESEDRDYYYLRFCDLSESITVKAFPVWRGVDFGEFESNSISDQCYHFINDAARYLSSSAIRLSHEYLQGLFQCDYQTKLSAEEYTEMLKSKISLGRLCFMDTNQSNQRIIMQQGLFMLPLSLNSDEHLRLIKKNTFSIKIHKSIRGELLEYLDTLGYNTFRLMPDLPNVCAAITQRVQDRV